MKNLKLVSELSLQLDLQFEGETIILSAFDIERSRVFFASSANLIYTLHLPSSSEKRTPWSNALLASEAEEVTLEPGENIVAMDYLMEKEALIIGSSSGCLILYNVDDKATEVVGRVEGGVTGIASSPDGALLSVTAGLGQLLVMTHDWEVLYEAGLDAQISNGVLADDPDGPSSSQTQSPISWRGDGKYFATLGGVDNSACLKKLMIWERESGMLLSTSEPKAFMGASLDWMPSGAKVAAAYDQKAESKCPLVVFFEKNGLERSSFPIGEPVEAAIEILKWNCNSELLAASVTCSQYDAIKIWCCSNNHWYLKQEIKYSKKEGVKFTWDPTKPLHLVCWTLGGHIMNYKFAWTSAVTETSTALVIDDSNILVTPLALSLIPPPMALFNLKFQSSVRDISFVSKSSKSHLAAFLSDGSLCVVELPETDTWDQFEGSQFSIEVCHSDSRMESFTHLTWLDSHLLLSVSCCCADYCSTASMIDTVVDHQQKKRTSCFSLHEIELVCSEDSLPGSVSSSGWQAKVTKTVSLDGPVICIVPNPAKRCSAFIQFSGGNVVEYSSNTGSLRIPTGLQFSELDSEYKFPSSCPSMKAVLCHAKGVARPLLFGLDDNGRLHVGKRTLTSSCSSFAFYCNTIGSAEQVVAHLLFTSKQDLLFIININDILCGNMEVKIDSYSSNHNKEEEGKDHVTIWEKGAKLIGVLHGDEAAALLQTCRGNLECIYPRKLVLVSIINALVQRRFRDAMVMVRRQRIDFNVLVDYCGWRAFVKSAAEFVSQVNNLGHITEFICAVKKENVINTLYKTYISLPNETSTEYADNSPSDCKESKVSSVLTAVRKALEEQVQETPARELCILTTLARTEPPALEEALNRIKVIRELELLGADDARRKLYPSAEESLKHLLWLTDPEAVYDAALGLYDLNLAAIVALNSQKDPKEFLPFLKGLECLSPVIMRYKIDLRLNRYDSALKHIVSAGDDYHEDCMNLLNSNPELFSLGLQLFTDPAKKRQILEAWGDHLYAAKCFEDAATTYLCCSSYQKSLKAYRSCGDWKCVLTVAAILKLGKEEILQLANELCEEFQELGKPAEAATIALEYCKDFVRGVRYYIMARKWEEALRIAYMHGREDLVTDVRDAALECASTLISEYQEGSEKLGKYLARYLAVRQRRLVLTAKIQLEDKSMSDAEYDIVSETSSFSGMSAYTTRTLRTSRSSLTSSKASKAHAARGQKGGKIRAGSPGEEMALVEHMKGMSLTAGAQCELKSLIIALLSLGKEDTARQLQYAGDKFELSHKAAIKLAEDTMASEKIDENSQTLEHYLQKLRSLPHPENHSWQIKVLLPPPQFHSSN
ncbi:elongator complex protein 1 [Typha angustifolia]|uniref:elongator complex protein 1 n=1 Tax=Typha angustifolia TaxID=59011 RepID=UPI003C2F10C9